MIGPIVRISPHELHINDRDFYHTLHRNKTIDKCAIYYNTSTTALVTTPDNKIHKAWRSGIRPFYSASAADERAPMIHDVVTRFCRGLLPVRKLSGDGEIVNLSNAFRTLAYEVVCRAYLSSDPQELIEPDFAVNLSRSFGEFTRIMSLLRQLIGPKTAALIGGAGNVGFQLLAFLPQSLHYRAIGWSPRNGRSIVHLQRVCSGICSSFCLCFTPH